MTLEKNKIDVTEKMILEAITINEETLSSFRANSKWLGLRSQEEVNQFRNDCAKYNKAINDVRDSTRNYIFLKNPLTSENVKTFWGMLEESDNFRAKYSNRISWAWEA